jgi:hypothetical protein
MKKYILLSLFLLSMNQTIDQYDTFQILLPFNDNDSKNYKNKRDYLWTHYFPDGTSYTTIRNQYTNTKYPHKNYNNYAFSSDKYHVSRVKSTLSDQSPATLSDQSAAMIAFFGIVTFFIVCASYIKFETYSPSRTDIFKEKLAQTEAIVKKMMMHNETIHTLLKHNLAVIQEYRNPYYINPIESIEQAIDNISRKIAYIIKEENQWSRANNNFIDDNILIHAIKLCIKKAELVLIHKI